MLDSIIRHLRTMDSLSTPSLERYCQVEEHRALGANEKEQQPGYITKLSGWKAIVLPKI